MRREEEQEGERKERTWKRKSSTVGVRVAWVGLNRCVHQSMAEKAHELVAYGVRAADSAPSRSFGALLRVSLRDVHLQLARKFESSSASVAIFGGVLVFGKIVSLHCLRLLQVRMAGAVVAEMDFAFLRLVSLVPFLHHCRFSVISRCSLARVSLLSSVSLSWLLSFLTCIYINGGFYN